MLFQVPWLTLGYDSLHVALNTAPNPLNDKTYTPRETPFDHSTSCPQAHLFFARSQSG